MKKKKKKKPLLNCLRYPLLSLYPILPLYRLVNYPVHTQAKLSMFFLFWSKLVYVSSSTIVYLFVVISFALSLKISHKPKDLARCLLYHPDCISLVESWQRERERDLYVNFSLRVSRLSQSLSFFFFEERKKITAFHKKKKVA